MSFHAKRELLAQVAPRYQRAPHAHKSLILDEFVAATGYARKYAIRLLTRPPLPPVLATLLIRSCVKPMWIAKVASTAFELSSNRVNRAHEYGGQGWIISPDGEVLSVTSRDQPVLTLELDRADAERAKTTYPRYALP